MARYPKRRAAWIAAALALTAAAVESETITLTTSYPSPAGIYRTLITTGGDTGRPAHTILARNAGNVGIGVTQPQTRLDVNGDLTVRGPRTRLLGLDGGGWHWLLAGTAAEGAGNALGFNLMDRKVQTGPGWTLSGAVRAAGGRFDVSCGKFYCPTVVHRTVRIPVKFKPAAAQCAPAGFFYTNSYLRFTCLTSKLGDDHVEFLTEISHGGHKLIPIVPVNYLIVGSD